MISSAYAIYSGMNGANVSAKYANNKIDGNAYNVFGFSLGDVESNLAENEIQLTGNYTTGIAYRGSDIAIENNHIVLISSEVGNESIWEGFGVEAVGVKVIKGNASIFNNTIATGGKGISLTGDVADVNIENNFINVVAKEDKDAYAIYAENVPDLVIAMNDIDYQGTTNGTGINNAVYLYNVTDAFISDNKFDLELISAYVPWAEIPAGSGNWVSSPISEGIVIAESDNVTFDSNNVTVVLGGIVGSYDTIYSVDVRNSNGAVTCIVEEKSATDEEKEIKEINSGIYCFDLKVLLKTFLSHREYSLSGNDIRQIFCINSLRPRFRQARRRSFRTH